MDHTFSSDLEHQFFALPIQQALTPTVSYRQYQQLTLLVIDESQWRAVFSLQGAQLLIWRPRDQANILWLSEYSAFEPGRAIRGGIPLCWPWFGDAGKPNHGIARTQQWQLKHWQYQQQCYHFCFQLNDSATTQASWPHAFNLQLTCQLTANTCQLQLQGNGDFDYTTALHSYFSVGDIEIMQLSGLGSDYLDKVSGQTITDSPAVIDGLTAQTDRIYRNPSPQSCIIDPLYQRKITIQLQNCSDVVLWNPGIPLAQQMSDIDAKAAKQFVCLETARIHQPVDARQPQQIGCHIQLTSLN